MLAWKRKEFICRIVAQKRHKNKENQNLDPAKKVDTQKNGFVFARKNLKNPLFAGIIPEFVSGHVNKELHCKVLQEYTDGLFLDFCECVVVQKRSMPKGKGIIKVF